MNEFLKSNKLNEYREIDWDSDEARLCQKKLAVILQRHFSKFGPFDYQDLAFNLLRHYQMAIAPMFCREDELAKLAKLKSQIRTVAETYASIHWLLHARIQMNSTLPLKVVNGAYVPGEEYTFTRDFSTDLPSFVAEQGLLALANNYKDLLPAIDKEAHEMPEGIQYKKRAHEAWRLVDAAASLCRQYPNTLKVPKSLNPTSPFHKLLEDLFDFFEIGTTPEGAFKGWYLHVDSKSES